MTQQTANPVPALHAGDADRPDYPLLDLLQYFLRLGTLGFGGPIALCGYMQRDLVERRGWGAAGDDKQGVGAAPPSPRPPPPHLGGYPRGGRAPRAGGARSGLCLCLPPFP